MRSAPEVEPPGEFQRIAPRLPAHAADAVPSRLVPSDASSRVSARTFLLGLVALLILGGLAFWLLPPLLAPPAQTARQGDPTASPVPAPAPATKQATPPATADFDDPELLRARAAAQEARAEYEKQNAQLVSAGVTRWAQAQQIQARQQSETGATTFAAKDFAKAKVAYEAAAAIGSQLVAEIPLRLAAALAAGNQALDAGDKLAAQNAFELALVLEPGNSRAQRGLERTGRLDAVRAKLETAARLEQVGDLAGARTAWNEALALDADTQSARDALARLDAQAADAEFRRVLGEAIAALDRGQLDIAEARLGRARALRGRDPAVQQAAARLAEARKSLRLAALNREASTQVQAEDWAGAVASYQAALQLEPNIGFARDGLAQAEPRALLAKRLQNLIARPERLSDVAVAAEARQLLAQARAVPESGPRLASQIASVERALAQSATPVAVELVSDQQTEVTIYKVGALGRFSTHRTQLKPGHYVAVGTRAGYRDVRKELEVPPGTSTLRFDIRCEEAL